MVTALGTMSVWAQTNASRSNAANPGSLLPLNPTLYGVTHWRAGESAEYLLTLYQAGHKEVKRIRYAILHELWRSPVPCFMVENQVTGLDENRHTTINSVTRPFGDLTNFLEGATGDFITKQDQSPAIAIPLQVLREKLMLSELQPAGLTLQSTEIIDRTILETPAGKFKTNHERFYFTNGRAVEVWWTNNAGPLGLVQATSKNFHMILTARQEKNSPSAITEIPKPWPGP